MSIFECIKAFSVYLGLAMKQAFPNFDDIRGHVRGAKIENLFLNTLIQIIGFLG